MNIFNEKNSNGLSLVRIIVAFVLICASLITIYVVVCNVANIKIAEGITVKGQDTQFFIKMGENQNDNQFFSDEKGLKCKKPDGSLAREEWIEKLGELFYFDTSGYGKNGDLKFEGQIYTFENGKLKRIVKDRNYSVSKVPEYFSSIDSISFIAYLEKEQDENGYYAIRYRRYGDEEDDYLGTEGDKQFASPYMLKINENKIYYLALGEKTDFSGKLYRMTPNGSLRDSIGSFVQGYIVLSSDVVYYYDGVHIIKAKAWKEEEVKVLEAEEDLEMLPLPDGEDGEVIPLPFEEEEEMNEGNIEVDGPVAKNNIFDNLRNAIPLPLDKENTKKENRIVDDEETIKNKENTKKQTETKKIKETSRQLDDPIIVEPLPIPKETVIDKHDIKSQSGYVEPIIEGRNAPRPPATNKPDIAINAPGD